jgi:hypothetical protein
MSLNAQFLPSFSIILTFDDVDDADDAVGKR